MIARKYIHLHECHWQILQQFATAKAFDSPSIAVEFLIKQLINQKASEHDRSNKTN